MCAMRLAKDGLENEPASLNSLAHASPFQKRKKNDFCVFPIKNKASLLKLADLFLKIYFSYFLRILRSHLLFD